MDLAADLIEKQQQGAENKDTGSSHSLSETLCEWLPDDAIKLISPYYQSSFKVGRTREDLEALNSMFEDACE
tara:strand:- start:333 stop:548 length:216 start_codon:yes stop_codon:yes gene_type:complete